MPIRQIIGSFEDIGKDIIRETVNVPKDIAGKALESMGTSSGKKSQTPPPKPTEKNAAELLGLGSSKQKTPVDKVVESADPNIKQSIARAALEYLAGADRPKQQPQDIFEKQKKEDQQKKDAQDEQKIAAQAAELPKVSTKRGRGDLFGINAKKTAMENRSIRQD